MCINLSCSWFNVPAHDVGDEGRGTGPEDAGSLQQTGEELIQEPRLTLQLRHKHRITAINRPSYPGKEYKETSETGWLRVGWSVQEGS